MKKSVIFLFFLLLAACGKENGITFCEGVNREGEGVKCGTKFEAGDLTALVNTEAPFETASIKIDVFQVDGRHEEKIESLNVETRPDDTRKAVPLSLYQGGKFKVRAIKGDNALAEGEVEIIEN